MFFSLNYYITTHFIIAIVSIVLGAFVFLKNRKRSVNRVFFLLTSSVFIWSISYSIWLLSKTPESALFWARTLNLGATLIPVFYFHWIIRLLNKNKNGVLIFYYILTAFFALFSYSEYYIWGTKQILQFPYWPQMNWLYILFLIFGWGNIIVYSIYLLIKELGQASGYYRVQIVYVLLGSIVGFIGGITNFSLMMGLDRFPPLGSPLVAISPIFFSYAIVRHNLMDIKVVLHRFFVYFFSLLSILVLSLTIKYVFHRFFINIAVWVDFIILILAISVFPPIRNFCFRLVNKYSSSLYDSQELIAYLSNTLRSTLDIKEIYNYITQSLLNTFNAKSIAVLISNQTSLTNKKDNIKLVGRKDDKSINFKIGLNHGFDFSERKGKVVELDKNLMKFFSKQVKPFIVEELKQTVCKKNKNIIKQLEKLNIEVVVPLSAKDKIIGFLIIGPKGPRGTYNDEDLSVLEIISAQAAIAIENALLYEEAKNFNAILKKEIKKATAELLTANKELKKLDKAKSEFISIASHQLRTPLTVIKGYISMMIEGSFGKLTKEKAISLKRVLNSNEKLIKLVEHLLNISRIESGRLQFNFQKTQLEKIIESTIKELAETVRKKGLRFKYTKPNKPLPKVKVDEEKIRQIIMNLFDNAVRYTKKGSITVSLSRGIKHIHLCVVDTGLGINKEDQQNLFKKFSRGKGISLIHPEGSGLSLYVAKIMIKAHHGKIWAESEGKGKGAKFCFSIPIE